MYTCRVDLSRTVHVSRGRHRPRGTCDRWWHLCGDGGTWRSRSRRSRSRRSRRAAPCRHTCRRCVLRGSRWKWNVVTSATDGPLKPGTKLHHSLVHRLMVAARHVMNPVQASRCLSLHRRDHVVLLYIYVLHYVGRRK